MRSYIFTRRERRILKRFVAGKISVKDRDLGKILSRIRTFEYVARDIRLYRAVNDRLAESKAAFPA